MISLGQSRRCGELRLDALTDPGERLSRLHPCRHLGLWIEQRLEHVGRVLQRCTALTDFERKNRLTEPQDRRRMVVSCAFRLLVQEQPSQGNSYCEHTELSLNAMTSLIEHPPGREGISAIFLAYLQRRGDQPRVAVVNVDNLM